MDGRLFERAPASRRALLLGLAGLAAVPLVGCAQDGSGGRVPELLMADGVGRNQPPADAPVGACVQGLSALGHRILGVGAEPGRNFVASPLSLAVAFAMARAGAAGTTAAELDRVFGFPAGGRDGAFNAITRQLVTVDVPPVPDRKPRDPREAKKPPVVAIGNALFPQKDFTIGAEFLRTLAAEYGTGVRPVDFADAGTPALINAWGEKQTAGRIKEIFAQLDPSTKLVLANAVYFKGDWQAFFIDVSDAPFTKADGGVVQASTMRRIAQVRYAESDGVTAIELPYAGGPYAMCLMLPPKGGKPEDTLLPAVLGKLRAGFADVQAEIAIPKWDFATSLDLMELMPKLGLVSAFGPGADFSGIAAGLFISDAVHKANITVDEFGTEAAAITGLGMAMSAPPQAKVRFIADRPFGFAIVGGQDGIPLFIGLVSDPTVK